MNQNRNQLLQSLIAGIEAGKILYICTCTRIIKIDRKTLARWNKAGNTILKCVNNDLWLASGAKFVCINYAVLDLR